MTRNYTPLRKAIADLISPPEDRRYMRYRLFQVLYWMHRGGEVEAAFIEASQIFLLVEFGRTASLNKTNSLRRMISLAYRDSFVIELLAQSGTASSFYRNLFADPMIFSPKKLSFASTNLYKLHQMNLLKLRDIKISYNKAFELGMFEFKRTTGRNLRDQYGCASYFVSAAILVDRTLLRIIPLGQEEASKRPGTFDKMTQEISADRERIQKFLAVSKYIIEKLDPCASKNLLSAWPDLEAAQCSIPSLTKAEMTLLTPKLPHTSIERKSTKRQIQKE